MLRIERRKKEEGALTELLTLIAELDSEINTWYYPNKDRKRAKKAFLQYIYDSYTTLNLGQSLSWCINAAMRFQHEMFVEAMKGGWSDRVSTWLTTNSAEIFKSPIPIEANRIELDEKNKLGNGSYAIVYKGLFHGKEVALKKSISIDATHQQVFDNEVDVFSLIKRKQHQNIVEIQGIVLGYRQMIIIFEYMAGGSLDKLITTHPDNLNPELQVHILSQIIAALRFLHAMDIVHCDLKPGNILLSADHRTAKLSDMGLAQHSKGKRRKKVGTSLFMAPEVRYTHPVPASDIYSFGVTAWETCERRLVNNYFNHSTQTVELPDIEGFQQTSTGMKKLILDCLNPLPEARPSGAEIDDVLQRCRL